MSTTASPMQLPGLDVTVERDVAVPMRDGVILRADIYRPTSTGPHDVLLLRTPYGKVTGQSELAYAHPAWYAAQGYAVVVQDTRGRWASEGTFYPWVSEGEDGYDTVEWAAGLTDVTGKVATYGLSYAGITQLLTAVLRPPHLVAIAPAMAGSQTYDEWTHNGGAPALAFTAFWAAALAMGDRAREGDAEGVGRLAGALADPGLNWVLPLSAHPALGRDQAPWYADWLEHPTYDDYWRRFSIDEDYSRIDVPALHVGGHWDAFLSGTVRNFRGLRASGGSARARADQKLVLAPLPHMPWKPIGADPQEAGPNRIDGWHLRFFAHHLRGEDTGIHNAPVTSWVAGRGWRDLEDWPPPDAAATRWHLHSGGRANSVSGDGWLSTTPAADEPPDIFTYDPHQPNRMPSGAHNGVEDVQPIGPRPQAVAEGSKSVLVYTTEVLDHEVELVGDVCLHLHAATDAADTDWTARLCVVTQDGVSSNVQEGILRAAYRTSTANPELIEPGIPTGYVIELGPVAVCVPAGCRLRLDIASSDFPQWARNLNTGTTDLSDSPLDARVATQVVMHDRQHPSHLELPIVDREDP